MIWLCIQRRALKQRTICFCSTTVGDIRIVCFVNETKTGEKIVWNSQKEKKKFTQKREFGTDDVVMMRMWKAIKKNTNYYIRWVNSILVSKTLRVDGKMFFFCKYSYDCTTNWIVDEEIHVKIEIMAKIIPKMDIHSTHPFQVPRPNKPQFGMCHA